MLWQYAEESESNSFRLNMNLVAEKGGLELDFRLTWLNCNSGIGAELCMHNVLEKQNLITVQNELSLRCLIKHATKIIDLTSVFLIPICHLSNKNKQSMITITITIIIIMMTSSGNIMGLSMVQDIPVSASADL